jgi:ribosome-associated protein
LETDKPLRVALVALEDAKAEQLLAIDLRGKTSLADSMVIASGRSDRHVAAIADRVIEALKQAGAGSVRVEGLPHADWVLIDCGDLLVHIFRPEVRGFYNLEKIWGVDRPSEPEEPRFEPITGARRRAS